MNVVDSSGWLEYFADGGNADFFAPVIEDVEKLLVPTLTIYEVFKRVYEQRGEEAALQAISLMQQGRLLELDGPTSLSAAKISLANKLPMADSIILASTRMHHATLWTQDVDFKDLEHVQFTPKRKS